jgi:hypothetical protein
MHDNKNRIFQIFTYLQQKRRDNKKISTTRKNQTGTGDRETLIFLELPSFYVICLIFVSCCYIDYRRLKRIFNYSNGLIQTNLILFYN